MSPAGVGSAEFGNSGCDFDAVSAPTATVVTVTIVGNKNKNKNILESCPLWGHNTEAAHETPHPTEHPNAPRMDRFCEFDNMDCIGLQYDRTFGMCTCIIFSNSLFYFFFVLFFVVHFFSFFFVLSYVTSSPGYPMVSWCSTDISCACQQHP